MYSIEPRPMDSQWLHKYQNKITNAVQAVRHIRAGERVLIGTGCAQPSRLVQAMVERAAMLSDLEIVSLFTLGDAPYARPEISEQIYLNTFFIADNVRAVVQQGLGNYTPIFLSEIPELFCSRQLPLDVALIQVSPPDEAGWCSLGISVDIVHRAVNSAQLVIAQVNEFMPRTLGETFVHVEQLHFLVPVQDPLIEYQNLESDPTTQQIARHIASLVEDGATLELGIGQIPQQVLSFLGDRNDLGIHSEMITDSILDLIQSGNITGKRKTLDPQQIVASFCLGTRRLYDYIHNNPQFCFHPTEYVNDPNVISRQFRMVAINTALEVDLTGQVSSDSLGKVFYSGIGGQVDFNRGAARSPGGKAIIALPSTAQNGRVSRIVPFLASGSGVVISRGDVHYVVTEHGVAYLHGKNIHQRALALICIAHPDFREYLLEEAIQANLLHPVMSAVHGRLAVGHRRLQTMYTFDDGTVTKIRAVHPTDEDKIRSLFHHLSEISVYRRFMMVLKKLTMQHLKEIVYIDHRNAIAVVATVPQGESEQIIAWGGYTLDPLTNRAEVAFMVADDWQQRGLGTFLFKHLALIARQNGIAAFNATVLVENRAMRDVFRKCGYPCGQTRDEDVVLIDIDLIDNPPCVKPEPVAKPCSRA